MDYSNRTYAFINTSDIGSVDFSQVMETSATTVRKSIDETLTFVKYEGDMPSSVFSLTTKQGPYTHSEILTILSGDAWTDNTQQV